MLEELVLVVDDHPAVAQPDDVATYAASRGTSIAVAAAVVVHNPGRPIGIPAGPPDPPPVLVLTEVARVQLPVLVVATEAAGKEAEYYLFEKMKSPANLTEADFDPARLKKK